MNPSPNPAPNPCPYAEPEPELEPLTLDPAPCERHLCRKDDFFPCTYDLLLRMVVSVCLSLSGIVEPRGSRHRRQHYVVGRAVSTRAPNRVVVKNKFAVGPYGQEHQENHPSRPWRPTVCAKPGALWVVGRLDGGLQAPSP